MAAHQEKASRLKAHIVFLDQSGFLTAPLVRCTWAPRGQTPVLLSCGRHREKASVIAALSISPTRQRVGLYFSLASNLNVDGPWMVHFLRNLLYQLRGPVLGVRGRLRVRKSAAVARIRRRCHRSHSEWLPPYAPELNPVELVLSQLKRNPPASFAFANANDLATIACRRVRRLQRRQDLPRSFIGQGRLSFRLW